MAAIARPTFDQQFDRFDGKIGKNRSKVIFT